MKKVLVIGEIMLDKYITGYMSKIATEAPVPVFVEEDITFSLGGAGNVAVNVAASGVSAVVAGIIGADEYSARIIQLFNQHSVDCSMLFQSTCNKNIIKTRLIDQKQIIIRSDSDTHITTSEEDEKKLLDSIKETISDFGCIILSDYAKGLFTDSLTKELIALGSRSKCKILVDPSAHNPNKYKNAYLTKPNVTELEHLLQQRVESKAELILGAKQFLAKIQNTYILVTCGANGMYLISDNDYLYRSSVEIDHPYVIGAGDTVIAYIAMGIVRDLPIEIIMDFAQKAAEMAVSNFGTSTIYIQDIVSRYNQLNEYIG